MPKLPTSKPLLTFLPGNTGPIRVVAFNTDERWSEDVPEDVALALRRRCSDVPSSIQDFVERHEGCAWRQLTLRLV